MTPRDNDGASPSRPAISSSAPEAGHEGGGVTLDALRSRMTSFSAKAKEKVAGQVTSTVKDVKHLMGSSQVGAGEGIKKRLKGLFH